MIETTVLLNLKPPHRKYYIIELKGKDYQFQVTARWGRVGARCQEQVKGITFRMTAYHIVNELIEEKIKKGYFLHQRVSQQLDKVELIEAFVSQL